MERWITQVYSAILREFNLERDVDLSEIIGIISPLRMLTAAVQAFEHAQKGDRFDLSKGFSTFHDEASSIISNLPEIYSQLFARQNDAPPVQAQKPVPIEEGAPPKRKKQTRQEWFEEQIAHVLTGAKPLTLEDIMEFPWFNEIAGKTTANKKKTLKKYLKRATSTGLIVFNKFLKQYSIEEAAEPPAPFLAQPAARRSRRGADIPSNREEVNKIKKHLLRVARQIQNRQINFARFWRHYA